MKMLHTLFSFLNTCLNSFQTLKTIFSVFFILFIISFFGSMSHLNGQVTQEWVQRYNGPGNYGDAAVSIAVDAFGNVYVTGSSDGNGTQNDYATIKYNSSGVEQWVQRYNGPGNYREAASSIAVDSSGNVYVTGSSHGIGTNSDYATIKYNSSGVEQWVQRYNGPGNYREAASSIAVDSSGNVYVTGSSHGIGTNSDYATIKYNSSGVEQWVQRYNGPGNSDDFANSMVVDASGNVYVTGSSFANGTDNDYATIKYNSAGVEQWVQRYNGPGNYGDAASSVAVDSSGNVYVTGSSFANGTDNDYATIKYNSAGVEQWVQRYNGPGNYGDAASSVAVDSSGNVYVTGSSFANGTDNDYATIKYNSAGVEQWVQRYDGNQGFDAARSIAIDDSGNVYVTGWIKTLPFEIVYATIKYNSSGIEQWVQIYNGPGDPYDLASSIAVDASGNVFVTGNSYGVGTIIDYATIKYNSSGVEQWVQRYDGYHHYDEVRSMAIDASGNVYVTGNSFGLRHQDYTTIKYNSSGVQQWLQRIDGPGDGDIAYSIAVDASGNVYVTGSMNGDYGTIKYSQQSQSITINAPTDNEILTAGTFKYINWNASSGITNVKLEYTSDNGTSWNLISSSVTANDYSYRWKVVNISSSQCKVRVSDKDNSSVKAESGVFTIKQINTESILNFKIKDITSTVKKIRFQYSPGVFYNTVPITNGQCIVNRSDLLLFPISGKINKIQLLDTNNELVGHINFEFKWSELFDKKVEAIIYIDEKTAFDVGYNPSVYSNDWNYFSNQNEHLVYMLIPPNEKFNDIRNTMQPLLFVHGIYGKYPYWGLQPFNIYSTYDGWQLYYPYDMRIRDCSYVLKKSVDKILSGDPTGQPYGNEFEKMNIVAHSMGGLVSRYYIQSNNDQKVNKLLMLGTPNNGSLSSFRSRSNELGTGTLGGFIGKDPKSPAHIDMSPASDFLIYMKSSPIKQLRSRNRNKSYLVIAGNKSISDLRLLHHESFLQDDGVVAVSSASLLDSLIPLATKNLDHTELPENISPLIINSFFNEDYDPSANMGDNSWLDIIIENVNGFYNTREDIKKHDNSGMNISKGILYFTIPGLNSNLKFQINHDSQNSYFIDIKNHDFYSIYLQKNPEVSVSYFTRNDETDITGALGLYRITSSQDNIKLKFRKKYLTFFGLRYQTIPLSTNTFSYKSLQTNWITLNLTDDEKHQINSNSFLQRVFSSSNIQSQKSFFVDNSIDTISFILYGIPNDTAFLNSNFKLTDPNNNLIDSVYANQHPNIIYRQSLEDAVAYYYIVDPEPGNWSAQYNPNISEPFLIAPIQSPVNPDLFFPDTVYAAGDSIKFFTTLPIEPGVTNLQYTANISFVRRGTNTELNLGNVVMVKKDHNTFGGQFFTRGIGEYRVKIVLNCNYNNQNIHRENYNSISVASIKVPISLYPKNDSLDVPQGATFKWNRNYNSDKYDLQIYKLGDTIPAFNYVNVTDTSFAIDSLQRETSYFWRIRALNNVDTSNWSEPKFFTSIVNIPYSVALDSPPDNSGGVFTPLSLQWSRSANAEKYHCQISTDSLFANLVFNDSTITDTITTVIDLIFPQTYHWRVRAINAGGNSEYSIAWTFNTVEPVSQSFVYVNVIPQGLFNLSNSSLNKSDTVTAYLINTSSPFTVIDSSKAVLDSSSFQASFEFSNAESGIYYLKIKHRNSIETWSKEGGESFNRYGKNYFDFTTSGTQAYGSNMIQINGKWCIYSGDVNQGGNIDLTDVVAINNDATVFSSGYLVTDLNGDYITDLTDLLMGFNNSSMFIAKITP